MIGKTLLEVAEQIRRKEVSPVEVAKHFLARVEALNPTFNAFITVTADQALARARAAEQRLIAGELLGDLDGIPIAIKDLIDTRGVRTTNGARIDRDRVPDESAPVVRNLERAGAVSLGKTNLHEYAIGITSNNPHFGSVRNPWNRDLSPGGSSGGSGAAVALRMCLGSVGTDTGGSIRIPAASCGIFGLKPTFGRVSTEGVTPISWSLDHVGPLAARMEDLAVLYDALLDCPPPASSRRHLRADIRGLRVGVPVNHFNERIEPEVEGLYRECLTRLEELGAVLIEVRVPHTGDILEVEFNIAVSEAGYVHRRSIREALDQFGDDVRDSLKEAHQVRAIDYVTALKRQEQIRRDVQALFDEVDLLATPTLPALPRPIGQDGEIEIAGQRELLFHCMIRYTCLFNVSGHPALSMPCGVAERGLPVGVQLVAPFHAEERLFRAGYAYQQHALGPYLSRLDELAFGGAGSPQGPDHTAS